MNGYKRLQVYEYIARQMPDDQIGIRFWLFIKLVKEMTPGRIAAIMLVVLLVGIAIGLMIAIGPPELFLTRTLTAGFLLLIAIVVIVKNRWAGK